MLVEHVHKAVVWALSGASVFHVRCVVGVMFAFLFMLRGASIAEVCWNDVQFQPPSKLTVIIRSLKTSVQASQVVVRSLELPLASEVWALGRLVTSLGLPPSARILPCGLNHAVQTVFRGLGVRYPAKGHSCRSGGASAALSLGVPLERVALHGVWTPGSGAIFRYVGVHVKVSPATFSYFGSLLPAAQRVGMSQLVSQLHVQNPVVG